MQRNLTGVVLLALAACGDPATDPQIDPQTDPSIATIAVTPATVTLTALGDTIPLVVVAHDDAGRSMAVADVVWTSSDPLCATVDTRGRVVAVANGTVEISATAEGVTGAAVVVVAQDVAGLDIVMPPAPLEAGVTWPTVEVVAVDANGHRVAAAQGEVQLHLPANPFGGMLDGRTAVALTAGAAVFADLLVDTPGCAYQLAAAYGDGINAVSATLDVVPPGLPRTVCVLDPVGDNLGNIDVTAMMLSFHPSDGSYRLAITAHPDHPFSGTFRLNVNLFNATLGIAQIYFFTDTMNDFTLQTPQQSLVLSHIHTALRFWDAGHAIHTNSLAGTGNPSGTSLFRSSVVDLPDGWWDAEDFIAFADLAQPAVVR